MVTGGLAADAGLIASLEDAIKGKPMKPRKGKARAVSSLPLEVMANEKALFAGAFGAALLGAYRYEQLKQKGRLLHTMEQGATEAQ